MTPNQAVPGDPTMQPIDTTDLTEEEIAAVINSTGFQKMLRYRRLAQGIEVLREEDEIFDSLVTTITKQHTHVTSEKSTREFFKLFRQEVETFTHPMVGEDDGEEQDIDLDSIMVEESEESEDA